MKRYQKVFASVLCVFAVGVGVVLAEPIIDPSDQRCGDANGGADASCKTGTCVKSVNTNTSVKWTETTTYYSCNSTGDGCDPKVGNAWCVGNRYNGLTCSGSVIEMKYKSMVQTCR